ncbi:hypothetical protein GQ85_06380 [Rhodococcus rhodochrous]|nr:hypothetical protein GQ85_06380 [Rhodococcus rhodochrous]
MTAHRGWRFNSLTPEGRIIGIPVGDYISPPATCAKVDPHKVPGRWMTGVHAWGDDNTPEPVDPSPRRYSLNLGPHDAPHERCACGHRIVTNLARLVDYEQRRHPGAFQWGTNRPKTADELAQPEHRVILHVAQYGRHTFETETHGDPKATIRVRQYETLHAYLRRSAHHLAEGVTAHHGIPVTVLDGEDFRTIPT